MPPQNYTANWSLLIVRHTQTHLRVLGHVLNKRLHFEKRLELCNSTNYIFVLSYRAFFLSVHKITNKRIQYFL